MGAKYLRYHEAAAADARSAIAWYRDRSLKAATDFLEELQRAGQTILQSPQRWPRGENNARRFPLWRFPFVVIYSEEEKVVTIWAVAHGSRRPDYWQERISPK